MILLIIWGATIVVTLFFIGNPRNPLVKKTTRTYKAFQREREQHQREEEQAKIQAEQQRQEMIQQAKIAIIHNQAIKSYNSWTYALQWWDLEQAIKYYNLSLQEYSGYINTWINKAITLNQLWDSTGAVESYDQAIKIDPHNFKARKNKWVIAFNQENYAQAIQDFNEAIKQNSWDVSVWINKWVAHYYLKQYNQSANAYDQALLVDPFNENAAYNAGMLAKEQKRYADAVKYFDIVTDVNPDKKDLWLARAYSAYASWQLMTAYDSFVEAYKRHPKQKELIKNLWTVSFDMWDYARAGKYFDTYLRLYGDNAEIRAYRGNAYYKQAQYQKAYLSYKKSLKLEENPIVKDNYYKALAKLEK